LPGSPATSNSNSKTWGTHPQIAALYRAIPRKYIKPAPAGKFGTYVPHWVIQQAIVDAVGPFSWELVQVLRGDSAGTVKGKQVSYSDVITGAVYRMTATIDGDRVTIEEPGSVVAYLQSDDGERLKKASSDALKRCGMRLGVGLHLWCKTPDEFFLRRVMLAAADAAPEDHDDDVVVDVESDDDEPDMADVPPDNIPTAPPGTGQHFDSFGEDAADVTVSTAEPRQPAMLPDPDAPIDVPAEDEARILVAAGGFTQGTNDEIEARVRALYSAMHDADIKGWRGDAFHKALGVFIESVDGLEPSAKGPHWADLARKLHMQEFATKSFDAAAAALGIEGT
jgi:hypothetical protein